MQRVYSFILVFCGLTSLAQTYDYSIGRQTEKVDSVAQLLLEYESFGIKNTGSKNLDSTRDWLVNKYQSFGYDQVFLDTFKVGAYQAYNIIIEKPGLTDQWIVIGAHYDSQVAGPGTNDNGSGVVACLEIARIIEDIECRKGVRIIHFSAEEIGLLGSSHYVRNDAGKNIDLMFNLDQLGGSKNANNSKIFCERDEDDTPSTNNTASTLVTDTLGHLISIYTNLTPVLGRAYGSDYVPFEDSGYVITGLYQESDYPKYHTADDRLEFMDTDATTEVIKGALAATLYFARNTLSVSVQNLKSTEIKLVPNPASNSIKISSESNSDIQIIFSNQLGERVFETKAKYNKTIDVSTLPAGIYFLSIFDQKKLETNVARLIIVAS